MKRMLSLLLSISLILPSISSVFAYEYDQFGCPQEKGKPKYYNDNQKKQCQEAWRDYEDKNGLPPSEKSGRKPGKLNPKEPKQTPPPQPPSTSVPKSEEKPFDNIAEQTNEVKVKISDTLADIEARVAGSGWDEDQRNNTWNMSGRNKENNYLTSVVNLWGSQSGNSNPESLDWQYMLLKGATVYTMGQLRLEDIEGSSNFRQLEKAYDILHLIGAQTKNQSVAGINNDNKSVLRAFNILGDKFPKTINSGWSSSTKPYEAYPISSKRSYMIMALYKAMGVNYYTAPVYVSTPLRDVKAQTLPILDTPYMKDIGAHLQRDIIQFNNGMGRWIIFADFNNIEAYINRALNDNIIKETDLTDQFRDRLKVTQDTSRNVNILDKRIFLDLNPQVTTGHRNPKARVIDEQKLRDFTMFYNLSLNGVTRNTHLVALGDDNSGYTLAEFARLAADIMFLSGEPAADEELIEAIEDELGTTIPEGITSDERYAIKYLMSKGVIGRNFTAMDLFVKVDDNTVYDIILKIADPNSRSKYRSSLSPNAREMAKQGFSRHTINMTNLKGVNWSVSATKESYNYYNYAFPYDQVQKKYQGVKYSDLSVIDAAKFDSMYGDSKINLLDITKSRDIVSKEIQGYKNNGIEVIGDLIDPIETRDGKRYGVIQIDTVAGGSRLIKPINAVYVVPLSLKDVSRQDFIRLQLNPDGFNTIESQPRITPYSEEELPLWFITQDMWNKLSSRSRDENSEIDRFAGNPAQLRASFGMSVCNDTSMSSGEKAGCLAEASSKKGITVDSLSQKIIKGISNALGLSTTTGVLKTDSKMIPIALEGNEEENAEKLYKECYTEAKMNNKDTKECDKYKGVGSIKEIYTKTKEEKKADGEANAEQKAQNTEDQLSAYFNKDGVVLVPQDSMEKNLKIKVDYNKANNSATLTNIAGQQVYVNNKINKAIAGSTIVTFNDDNMPTSGAIFKELENGKIAVDIRAITPLLEGLSVFVTADSIINISVTEKDTQTGVIANYTDHNFYARPRVKTEHSKPTDETPYIDLRTLPSYITPIITYRYTKDPSKFKVSIVTNKCKLGDKAANAKQSAYFKAAMGFDFTDKDVILLDLADSSYASIEYSKNDKGLWFKPLKRDAYIAKRTVVPIFWDGLTDYVHHFTIDNRPCIETKDKDGKATVFQDTLPLITAYSFNKPYMMIPDKDCFKFKESSDDFKKCKMQTKFHPFTLKVEDVGEDKAFKDLRMYPQFNMRFVVDNHESKAKQAEIEQGSLVSIGGALFEVAGDLNKPKGKMLTKYMIEKEGSGAISTNKRAINDNKQLHTAKAPFYKELSAYVKLNKLEKQIGFTEDDKAIPVLLEGAELSLLSPRYVGVDIDKKLYMLKAESVEVPVKDVLEEKNDKLQLQSLVDKMLKDGNTLNASMRSLEYQTDKFIYWVFIMVIDILPRVLMASLLIIGSLGLMSGNKMMQKLMSKIDLAYIASFTLVRFKDLTPYLGWLYTFTGSVLIIMVHRNVLFMILDSILGL